MTNISGELIGYGFLRNLHRGTLCLSMTFIQWKFLVDLHELPFVVVDFLPETNRPFGSVDFLDIDGSPSGATANFEAISAAPGGQCRPCPESPLILSPRAHRRVSRVLPRLESTALATGNGAEGSRLPPHGSRHLKIIRFTPVREKSNVGVDWTEVNFKSL